MEKIHGSLLFINCTACFAVGLLSSYLWKDTQIIPEQIFEK